MSEFLLQASGVSKTYTLWRRPSGRLLAPVLESLARRFRGVDFVRNWAEKRLRETARPFAALKPVSFSIRRGESLGIIGRNGSGKSTLLQILAGTLTPSAGTVERRGRLAALLELGSGFNPEFTGRENVYLQGSIYGVKPSEIESHFQEVAAFADIGQFIDQPVKTYSSGMMVRLAFAVQIVLEPEVLIVDEALAVGDVFFQAKCAAYFQERLAQGMSLIFVSHDLVSVKTLCQQAIVLHEGEVKFQGESKEAVSYYHALHTSHTRQTLVQTAAPVVRQTALPERNWQSKDEIGTKEAEFFSCSVTDSDGKERRHFGEGETILITLHARCHQAVPALQAAFQIVDRHNRALYGVSTIHQEVTPLNLEPGAAGELRLEIPGQLGSGEYLVDVALGWGDRGDGAFAHQCHRVGGIVSLAIGRVTPKARFLGPVDLHAKMAWLVRK